MANTEKIKVGYLVSYDYKYLEYALPPIYESADIIVLAIDKDRLTWSGEPFVIPNSFFEWIDKLDTQKKVRLYEDSFYVPNMPALECDTRERNMLTKALGTGGWHIQVDSDEYFLDFKSFVKFLWTLDFKTDVNIYAELITIFKQNENDYFLIDSNERFPLASNNAHYVRSRSLDQENRKLLYTQFKLLHQSWGRSTEEMQKKLSNWGHKTDFDIESYFNLWKVVNKHTYQFLHNFHPLDGTTWKTLEYFEAATMSHLIEKVKESQASKKQNKSFLYRLFSKKKR